MGDTAPTGASEALPMRLLLLGATGRTGGELLVQALAQGHEVTALARDPGTLRMTHPRIRIVVGSATDGAAIQQAVEGHDAVLCALGPRSPKALISCHLMRATVDALIPSMTASGVSRLVLLSALGVGPERPPRAGGIPAHVPDAASATRKGQGDRRDGTRAQQSRLDRRLPAIADERPPHGRL